MTCIQITANYEIMTDVLDLFSRHLKNFEDMKYWMEKSINVRKGEHRSYTSEWQLNSWIFFLEMIKFITNSCTSHALKM